MRNKKFTLVELIVTIIVLGILAAIILLNISNVKDRALDTAKSVNLSEMQKIVDMYYLERDIYPTIVQPTLGPEKVEQSMLVTEFQKKKIKHEFCVQPTGEVIFFEDCDSVALDKLPLPVDVLTCEEAIKAGYEKCISNQEELKSIEEGLYSRYIIVNDFNITGEWDSINLPDIEKFVELNGNGYSISDLFINTKANRSGMFSQSNNIMIKNLKLLNAKLNVNGHEHSGLLIGYTNGSLNLDNILVLSEITGSGNYVGSLIGSINNPTGKQVDLNATNIVGNVKANLTSGDEVGGLFGSSNGNIENVKVVVDIKGSGSSYGGVAGTQFSSANLDNKTSNVHATGTVENDGDSTGMIFGGLYTGLEHSNISAKGTVIGGNQTGGLFGSSYSNFKNLFFDGNVSGIEEVGGIVGQGGVVNGSDDSINIEVKGSIYGTGDEVGGIVGTFSGEPSKGYKVDVEVIGDGKHVGGLFGMLNSSTHDITGKVIVTGHSGYVGGVAGQLNGELENAVIKGEVYGAKSNIGGIIGEVNQPISDVHYEGLVQSLNPEKSDYMDLGGIAGATNNRIDNVSFKGTISANETYVGGITGRNNNPATNLSVEAQIESTNSYLGGVVGEGNNPISKAIFKGTVKSTFGDHVGGLTGHSIHDLEDVAVEGEVSSTGDYTGGITGKLWSSITNAQFNGDIISKGNLVGGIAGYSQGSSPNLLGVIGTISAEGNNVGGIFGETPYGPQNGYVIATIYNTGNYTGGIIGNMLYNSIGKVYFSGEINASNNVDPIIANIGEGNSETIKNNSNSIMYWNSDLYTGPTNGLGSGKTDSQLKDISTFTGWDFESIWTLESYLRFK